MQKIYGAKILLASLNAKLRLLSVALTVLNEIGGSQLKLGIAIHIQLLIFHVCALFLNPTNRQTMYDILLSLHNLLRWIILFLLVLNLIRHFAAINRPFNGLDKRLGLWLMIAAHITLLIGLYQWFAGNFGLPNILHNGMAAVMQNPTYRFFAVEHTVGMLIAITLITIARGVYRKQVPDGKKHRRCIVFYILALVIILASIPWPGMEEISRPLFRNF